MDIKTSLTSIEVNNEDPEKTRFESKKNDLGSNLVLSAPLDEQGHFATTSVTSGELLSIESMMKDLLQGDKDILNRPEFQILNFKNILKAIEWLSNNNLLQDSTKNLLLTEGWRLNYRCKPPTPEEFLTERFIGAQAESLYPPVRQIFLDAMNQTAPYDTIVLATCIGLGKNQPLDSKVYVDKDHYKLMGDIQVGDKVLSPDGSQTEVVKTQDWDPMDIYEIELEDGRKMRCGLHHLHNVTFVENGQKVTKAVETQFLLEHPEIDFEFEVFDKD